MMETLDLFAGIRMPGTTASCDANAATSAPPTTSSADVAVDVVAETGDGDEQLVGGDGTNDHWNTPATPLERVHAFFHHIDLDPCSNPTSLVGARVEWYGPDRGGTCGLTVPWAYVTDDHLPLRVFANPPYSAKLQWARKMAEEARDERVEIIGLMPADTDSAWFHQYALTAKCMCFWRGRMRFLGRQKHPARFPCVLPYWGPRPDRFVEYFESLGWVARAPAGGWLRS